MSSLDIVDAPSQAQLQAYIQNALQDGLAQSEAAREQQAAQLQELHQPIQQLLGQSFTSRYAMKSVADQLRLSPDSK
ncbi:hypothetical protein E4U11_007649 [Claviceps purpurea]|nr:hypothetical protein E4U11_007649 [Claviceps purpurea]